VTPPDRPSLWTALLRALAAALHPTTGQSASVTPDQGEEQLHIALPSRHQGICFRARFTVSWRRRFPELGGPGRTDAPLRSIHNHLYAMASKVSELQPITMHDEARDLIRVELAGSHLAGADVELFQVELSSLDVDEALRTRVAEYEAQRVGGPLSIQALREEMAEVDFIRRELLSDGGRARAWWFKKHPEDLATIRDGTFDEIAERLSPPGRREPGRSDAVAELIRESLDRLEPSGTGQLLTSLERVLREVGIHDLAYRLRAMLPIAEDPAEPRA
jgi:hypothetical protein